MGPNVVFSTILLTVAAAIAAGCGGSPTPDGPTAAPTPVTAATQGKCGTFLRPGPIAFNGKVVSVGEAKGGYPDYDHGWQVIGVRVETAAAEGSQVYRRGTVVDVNLFDPLFPIVTYGDCVAASGSERLFYTPKFPYSGIVSEIYGFVADHFDVLTVE